MFVTSSFNRTKIHNLSINISCYILQLTFLLVAMVIPEECVACRTTLLYPNLDFWQANGMYKTDPYLLLHIQWKSDFITIFATKMVANINLRMYNGVCFLATPLLAILPY